MLVTDAKAKILIVNPSFTRITGYRPEEVTGRNPRLLQSGRHDVAFYARMWDALRGRGSWQGEIWDRRKGGEIYPGWLAVRAVRDYAQRVHRYVGVFSDITERKEVEEDLRRLAYFDSLTGLPNRTLLSDRIDTALATALREGCCVALLFIDLDGFKSVNDRFGHELGDRALEIIADCVALCLRASDTVARVGGDEFVVLLPGIETPADAAKVARKIIRSLRVGVVVEGHEIRLGASVGISTYPGDGDAARDLLRQADGAMYDVKKGGKCGYGFVASAASHRPLPSDWRPGPRSLARPGRRTGSRK